MAIQNGETAPPSGEGMAIAIHLMFLWVLFATETTTVYSISSLQWRKLQLAGTDIPIYIYLFIYYI